MTELRNIEAERVRYSFTKESLASRLGVSSRTYYSWIKRETEIPSGTLITLSKLFNVSIDYLLQIEPPTDYTSSSTTPTETI